MSARALSEEYIEKSKLNDIFQHIVSLLVLMRPEDPRSFLVEELTKMEGGQPTTLIDDADIDTMFDMLNISQEEFVDGKRVLQVLSSLAVKPLPEIEPDAKVRHRSRIVRVDGSPPPNANIGPSTSGRQGNVPSVGWQALRASR